MGKLGKVSNKKYPRMTFIADNHFNWRFSPESVKETIHEITMIEATYIAKKHITKSKKNIFECVEKLEKKHLTNNPN